MKPRQPSIIEKVPIPAGNCKDKGAMDDIVYNKASFCSLAERRFFNEEESIAYTIK